MSTQIVREFPQPTTLILSALAELRIAGSDDVEAKKKLGPLSALPRPWDPPSCPVLLRRELWWWLDRVSGWLNHEYTWQAERAIPSCWPAHPHIAHDLAVLACLRHAAGEALTPEPLEEWHRYALPGFLDRLGARLGGTPCQPGSHKPWPAASRHTDYESAASLGKRLDAFDADATKRDRGAPPPPSRNANGNGNGNGSRTTRTALTLIRPADPLGGSTP